MGFLLVRMSMGLTFLSSPVMESFARYDRSRSCIFVWATASCCVMVWTMPDTPPCRATMAGLMSPMRCAWVIMAALPMAWMEPW